MIKMAVVRRRTVPSSKDNIARENKEEVTTSIQEERNVMQQVNSQRESYKNSQEDIVKASNGISKYILEDFIPSKSETKVRERVQRGVLSMVNSKCCKKISISREVMNKLNNPKKVSMSFSEYGIAIGEQLPNNDNLLSIKINKNKANIYSSELVSEITDMYELDFNSRTSITFSEAEYIKYDGFTIAIIKF
jgi:hypothetical protein